MEEAFHSAMSSDAVMVFKDAGVLYALTNTWTAAAYQQRNPTADDFCTDLTTMRQWHDDLKRARNQVRGRVGRSPSSFVRPTHSSSLCSRARSLYTSLPHTHTHIDSLTVWCIETGDGGHGARGSIGSEGAAVAAGEPGVRRHGGAAAGRLRPPLRARRRGAQGGLRVASAAAHRPGTRQQNPRFGPRWVRGRVITVLAKDGKQSAEMVSSVFAKTADGHWEHGCSARWHHTISKSADFSSLPFCEDGDTAGVGLGIPQPYGGCRCTQSERSRALQSPFCPTPTSQVEFAAFVAAARPHMTGGTRTEAVLADRHTTVTFAELMEASGMVPGRKAAAAAEEKAGLESGSKLASQCAKELSEQLDALTGHTPEAQAAREAAALAHESAADSALSGMLDAFDDYFHETQMCDSFVSETTPVMIAVLRKAVSLPLTLTLSDVAAHDTVSRHTSLRGGMVL